MFGAGGDHGVGSSDVMNLKHIHTCIYANTHISSLFYLSFRLPSPPGPLDTGSSGRSRAAKVVFL